MFKLQIQDKNGDNELIKKKTRAETTEWIHQWQKRRNLSL